MSEKKGTCVASPLPLLCLRAGALLYVFVCERVPQSCMTRATGASSPATPFPQLGGQQAPRVLPAGRWLLSVKVREFSSLLSSLCSRSERTWSALRSGARHAAARKVCDCSSIYLHACMYLPYMRTGNVLSSVLQLNPRPVNVIPKPYRLQAMCLAVL